MSLLKIFKTEALQYVNLTSKLLGYLSNWWYRLDDLHQRRKVTALDQ